MTSPEEDQRPLRIACYGWVDRDGGSAVSGHFLVVEDLLRRGHSIDFFAIQGTSNPKSQLGVGRRANFSFQEVPALTLWLRWKSINLGQSLGTLVHMFMYAVMKRRIENSARRRHALQPYDVCLFLGRPPDFRIPGVPSIAWVQGPSQTELSALWARRKEIAHLRSWWFATKVLVFRSLRTVLARRAYSSANVVICGSAWSKSHILSFARTPPKVHVLPYPVDLQEFRPTGLQAELRAGLSLLWLGRIEPRKRFPLLIDAIDELISSGIDVKLRVYGSWTYVPEYQEYARHLIASGHVAVCGPVDRNSISQILARSDILVQPSEAENFGTAVAEALSAGVPVVVGPSNGTREYLPDCCEVFDEYDPVSLCHAIKHVSQRLREQPQQVIRECRLAAEKQFSTHQVTEDLLSLARTLVGSRTNAFASSG